MIYFLFFRDDHVLLKWNLVTNEAFKVCELPSDLYPTDFHSFLRQSGKKQGQDQLLVTSTDGMSYSSGCNA